MKPLFSAFALASLTLCSCGKVRIVSPEQAEMESKMEALRTEDAELQQKIITLRQVLPPDTTSLTAAANLATKYQGDNQQIARQLAQVVKDYEASEASFHKLQGEVEALRKVSAR